MPESQKQKKGGVDLKRMNLNGINSPCDPACPKRAIDCHVRGNCPAYDAFADKCAELRERRALEADVNTAISQAVARYPGERRV